MKTQLAPTIILLCWAGVSAPALVLAEQPLIVGVLEDVEPGNLSPGMAMAHVRIAFKKQGAEWVAFPTDFNTPESLADSPSLEQCDKPEEQPIHMVPSGGFG